MHKIKLTIKQLARSGSRVVVALAFAVAMLGFSPQAGFGAQAILGALGVAPQTAVATSADCPDLQFVFARGSGEALAGPSATAWQTALTAALAEAHDLTYAFYELGQQAQAGFQYPATAVSGDLSGYLNLVGAYVGSGEWFAFGRSVQQGVGELQAYVAAVSARCPNTKFVLGGYSQGAMIISQTLPSLDAERIVYAATFGDPKLYLPEGLATLWGLFPKVPDACYGVNLSEYREHVPDCHAYEGILGGYHPYQPVAYSGKLGTWCNELDIMCSSGFSTSDHTAYVSSNLYADAAHVIGRAVAKAFPEHFARRPVLHELVFVIDTTASMEKLIDEYIAEALAIARQIFATGGRVALYEYRDHSDTFLTRELCDFTCDLATLTARFASLTTDGGGDTPEAALPALYTAMDSLTWTNGATKSMVLLTDASFHNPDYLPNGRSFTLNDVVKLSLAIDPVNVYVLTESLYLDSYQTLTSRTGGQAFAVGDALSASALILNRPVARLSQSAYSGVVGSTLSFDASASVVVAGADELSFDWDLDGDGLFELTDAGAIVSTTYSRTFTGFIQVRVRDAAGRSSTMSAAVRVVSATASATTEALATIQDLTIVTSTQPSGQSAAVSFSTDAATVLLAVDDAIIGQVALSAGQGSFTLGELVADTDIRLIPYSSSGRRGQSLATTVALANINVGTSVIGTTNTNAAAGTITNSSAATNSATTADSAGTTGTAASFGSAADPDPTATPIPLAPNTGYAP